MANTASGVIVLGVQEEKTILRIDVPRSLFVLKSPNGYFRQIGSSKREMKPEVLARLFQQRSQAWLIRFDEQTAPCARPSAVS
jgi:hypothetical protein